MNSEMYKKLIFSRGNRVETLTTEKTVFYALNYIKKMRISQ